MKVYAQHWVAIFALTGLCATMAGCAGSAQGNARDFREARDAYMACVKERGTANCTAERDVMNAAAVRY
jgi:hypothetical protein